MMGCLPIPYCGKHDLLSPDLETAAESCLNAYTGNQRKFKQFKSNLRYVN